MQRQQPGDRPHKQSSLPRMPPPPPSPPPMPPPPPSQKERERSVLTVDWRPGLRVADCCVVVRCGPPGGPCGPVCSSACPGGDVLLWIVLTNFKLARATAAVGSSRTSDKKLDQRRRCVSSVLVTDLFEKLSFWIRVAQVIREPPSPRLPVPVHKLSLQSSYFKEIVYSCRRNRQIVFLPIYHTDTI